MQGLLRSGPELGPSSSWGDREEVKKGRCPPGRGARHQWDFFLSPSDSHPFVVSAQGSEVCYKAALEHTVQPSLQSITSPYPPHHSKQTHPSTMRVGEIAARALLGGMAMDNLESLVTPNPAALLIRQSGCSVGSVACSTGCIPIGSDCCASYVRPTLPLC